MCPAIHISSRSWLRSSSTHEPSDPPLRIVLFNFCFRGPWGTSPPADLPDRVTSRRGKRENGEREVEEGPPIKPRDHRGPPPDRTAPDEAKRVLPCERQTPTRARRRTGVRPARAGGGGGVPKHDDDDDDRAEVSGNNVNDPSAGSPTETLLRLLLPLNDQV